MQLKKILAKGVYCWFDSIFFSDCHILGPSIEEFDWKILNVYYFIIYLIYFSENGQLNIGIIVYRC